MSTDPRIRATRPEIWFNAVTSICPECGRDVNGKHHLTAAGHVVMRQFCPAHGHRAVLVSTDFEWFTRYEQMAAMFPPRADRAVPEGTCCLPELAVEADAPAERARKLLWLRDASPGAVHFTAGDAVTAAQLAEALGQARQVGIPCVSVGLSGARTLELAATLESHGALAHVDAEDPRLAELLERRPSLPVVQVSRLDRADLAAPLAAAFRRFRDAPGVVSWELVPRGTVAAAWHQHDHHPSKGPEGLPSNGPVPAPGPVPATLSEALPLVQEATGLDKEAFFPLQRFHAPGSALAVVRTGDGGALESLNAKLAPRAAIDLVAAQVPLDTRDAAVLAVRALFGATGRMHPSLVTTLVRQGLREGGGLVADDHRAEAAGPAAAAGAIKTVIVHYPLTRLAYDRTRHLRACPVPRDQRDVCNDACAHRAR